MGWAQGTFPHTACSGSQTLGGTDQDWETSTQGLIPALCSIAPKLALGQGWECHPGRAAMGHHCGPIDLRGFSLHVSTDKFTCRHDFAGAALSFRQSFSYKPNRGIRLTGRHSQFVGRL